jgi:hypothetical protein
MKWRDNFIITLMKLALLEKLIVAQLVKKFLAFYESRRFITVFTRTRYRSIS